VPVDLVDREVVELDDRAVPEVRTGIVDRLLKKLSRVTSTGSYIPEIDGLRFFAIMPVIIFHLNGYIQKHSASIAASVHSNLLNDLIGVGNFGVQLFFAISGFILSMPFAMRHLFPGKNRPISLKAYYLRRVTRLEPPYIINLLVMFCLQVYVLHNYAASYLLPHLAASLFYVHNIIYRTASLINVPAWSLEVEVQFYILAPLIAQVFRIRKRWLRMLVFVMLPPCVAMLAKIVGITVWKMNICGSLAYFIVGFVLADLFLLNWNGEKVRRGRWDAVGMVAWASMPVLLLTHPKWSVAVLPLSVFFAYWGMFRGSILNRVARQRWLVVIGGMCYSIYLYHCFFIGMFGRVTLKFAGLTPGYPAAIALQTVLMVPIVLAACAIMFVYFEKPFMYKDWPGRLAGFITRAGKRRTF